MTRQFLTAMMICVAAAGMVRGQDQVVAPLPMNPDAVPVTSWTPGPQQLIDSYAVDGPFYRFSASVEGLYWFFQGSRLPPLVISAPTGTARDQIFVGALDSQILVGDTRENEDAYFGVRVRGTYWLDRFEDSGIEVVGFRLGDDNRLYNEASAGDPILARPFINALTGLQDAQLIAFPGVVSGNINIRTRQDLWGAEINGRQNLKMTRNARAELIYGVRYLQMEDDLDITEQLTSQELNSAVIRGTTLDVSDSFDSTNRYALLQLGFAGEVRRGIFGLEFFSKLGFGAAVQSWRINGATAINVPGFTPVVTPTGLFANNSNLGRYTQKYIDFAFVPEIGLNLKAHLGSRITVSAGYTFLYLYPATRPGDVLYTPIADPSMLSPTGIPANRIPERSIGSSDMWVQGVNGMVEVKF